MDKYGADYIMLNKNAMEFYNISKISYVDDYCFPIVFSGENLWIYKKKCSLG